MEEWQFSECLVTDKMKACNFCGCKVDDKDKSCPSCGSTTFQHVCPHCSNLFEGSFCPSCGVRYDAVPKTCPKCGTKYFARFCTHCGYNPEKSWTAEDGSHRNVYTFNNNENGAGNNGIIAIVFGCLGLFTCMFPFSIIAIVCAVRDKNKGNFNRLSRTGLVLGIVGLFLTVILFLNAIIQSVAGAR